MRRQKLTSEKNSIDAELDEMYQYLCDVCTFGVHCIGCGKLVMYADPTHHEGMQLPDMICLECKKGNGY